MRRQSLKLRTDYWHQEGKYAQGQRVRVLTMARLVHDGYAPRMRGGRLTKAPVKLPDGRTVMAHAVPPPAHHVGPVDSVLVAPVDERGRVDLSTSFLVRCASLVGEWETVKASTEAAKAKHRAEMETQRAAETDRRARHDALTTRLQALTGTEAVARAPWQAAATVSLTLGELELLLDRAERAA